MTPEEFVASGNYYFNDMEEEAKTVCEFLQRLGGEDGESSQKPLENSYRLSIIPPAIQARSWITQKQDKAKYKENRVWQYL